MRKMVVLLVVALALSVSGIAQSLAPKSSFNIEAKEVASKRTIGRRWETDYGSYDRNYTRSRVLSIEVRNLSRLPPGECKLQVFWMARNLANRKPFVHDAGTIDTRSGASQTYTHECKDLPANVTNYALLGQRYVSGAKIDGWLVLLTRDDEVLASRASNTTYAQIMADPKKREELLATTPENNALREVPFRWN